MLFVRKMIAYINGLLGGFRSATEPTVVDPLNVRDQTRLEEYLEMDPELKAYLKGVKDARRQRSGGGPPLVTS